MPSSPPSTPDQLRALQLARRIRDLAVEADSTGVDSDDVIDVLRVI